MCIFSVEKIFFAYFSQDSYIARVIFSMIMEAIQQLKKRINALNILERKLMAKP